MHETCADSATVLMTPHVSQPIVGTVAQALFNLGFMHEYGAGLPQVLLRCTAAAFFLLSQL